MKIGVNLYGRNEFRKQPEPVNVGTLQETEYYVR
jgi:hypothetical protein